jgi:ATP-dependent DNA helicase RecG
MNERKYKVFISSVQKEFEPERTALEQFFSSDVLLQSFFETFLFERISATRQSPESIFLREVQKADLYIGLLGKKYGFEGKDGISPTEREYEAARKKKFHAGFIF